MQFKLKINSDVINFINIETNAETGLPVNKQDSLFFNVLSSDPSIVEITNFEYNPQEGSVWNGTDFIDTENREVRPLSRQDDGFKKFAFAVNNKYKLFYAVPDITSNEMIIALLSSNPKVIAE